MCPDCSTTPSISKEQLAYSLAEAAEALSLSLSTMKELVRTGEIGSVSVGRRRIIPKWQLESFLALKAEEARLTQVTRTKLQAKIESLQQQLDELK